MVAQLRSLLANEMAAVEFYTHAIARSSDSLASKLCAVCREHRALVVDLQHALGPESAGIFRGENPTTWSKLPRLNRLMSTRAGGTALVAILRRGEAEGLQLAARTMRPQSARPLRRFVRACVLSPLRQNMSALDAVLSGRRRRRDRLEPNSRSWRQPRPKRADFEVAS